MLFYILELILHGLMMLLISSCNTISDYPVLLSGLVGSYCLCVVVVFDCFLFVCVLFIYLFKKQNGGGANIDGVIKF